MVFWETKMVGRDRVCSPMMPSVLSWKGLLVWRQAKETRWKLRFMEL